MPTRDPWLDNAKMTLVTLVVVGHAWTLLPSTPAQEWLYDFLYAWHVPAFVFVTGYLSRSFDWSRRRMVQLVTTVVVPYLVFESLMSLYRMRVGDEQLEGIFADPHWPMWYLAALFFWRLATPVLKVSPWMVPLSVAVSLVAGVWAGDTLDLARVCGLLPFFALGLHATPERLELLRTRAARPLAVVVLLAVLVLAFWTDTWLSTEWLYYRSRYDELDLSVAESMAARGVLLAVGTAGAFAVLALVSRRSGWFTRMGAWTLVVYLVHGFVVKSASYAGFDDWADAHTWLSFPLTTLLAVGLALLLAWEPLARRFGLLVDPYGAVLRATEPRRRRPAEEPVPDRTPVGTR